MSVQVVTRVLEQSRSRLAERLVLLALADRADDSGRCWPSVEDIQKRANLSERAVSLTVSLISRHYTHIFVLCVRNDGRERAV
ncbi:MAG: helix-turn-helix domain-containing protein [Betaproteobacteria bacterium]